MNYNLLKHLHRGPPGVQCILPLNLSTEKSRTEDLHSPHIEVVGKHYESIEDWYLTGTLDRHERCGEIVRALGCVDYGIDTKKHNRIIQLYSCHRPGCPTCYESWAFRVSEKSSHRLIEGQKLYHDVGKNFQLKHTIFSPPVSEFSHIKQLLHSGDYNKFKADFITMMKKAGICGGAIVLHLWRYQRANWVFSPHFHVISAGFLIPSTKFYNDTGWVYKNLGKRKSIKDTIFYLLTHCANNEKHHALSYFGIFSYNKISLIYIEKVEVQIPCSACGKILHEYAIDYGFNYEGLIADWYHDKGIYHKTVLLYHYILHSKYNNQGYYPIFIPKKASMELKLVTSTYFMTDSELHEIERYINL